MSISPTSLLPNSLSTTGGLGTTSAATTAASSIQPIYSNYAQTGIASISGSGYAYPPGSTMASFMDNINNTVASCSAGPNGGSIIDWANGLVQQAKLRQQMQAAAQQQALEAQAAQMQSLQQATASGTSTASSLSRLYQIYDMAMTMMASLKTA